MADKPWFEIYGSTRVRLPWFKDGYTMADKPWFEIYGSTMVRLPWFKDGYAMADKPRFDPSWFNRGSTAMVQRWLCHGR